MDEAAALPSPRVVLSRGLKRYYGRLRLPPGSPVVSRSAVIDQRRSGALRRRRAGEGLPSSHRHLPSVPSPLRRGVPRGLRSRLSTPSMAFAVRDAARLSLSPAASGGHQKRPAGLLLLVR